MNPALILRPHGRLGNHILQWATGQTLARMVPGLTLHGFDLPHWGLSGGGYRRRQWFLPAITQQDTDLRLVAEMMRAGTLPLARLWCMVLQADMWGEPERFRRLLPLSGREVQTAGAGEILLNVRADEILRARHPDYGPIPLGFYMSVLRNTGLRPVFMGQLGADDYSCLLKESFPEARFIPSQGELGDFEAMRRARHLAISVSTFSWAAGWLSEAESVHMPLLGFCNPAQRPDISLVPQWDARYSFYGFPTRKWKATDAQVAALRDLTPVPVLSAAEVEDLHARARELRKEARMADQARLVRSARLIRPILAGLRRVYTVR
ncbi:MAG: hypothetical protein MUD11_04930 [Rhodobacteraceae bacterium]|jgi:hypothetical protein|nr:hypothetical protein [Paracoccaceae bacterium]